MFRDREDAAFLLAQPLKDRSLRDPIVLGIPRGGVVIGAVLARELGADLDVILSRKLRALGQPELAIGALSEEGAVFLDPSATQLGGEHLKVERGRQLAEIERGKKLFRRVLPQAPLVGRSVIVADDGIATGSTMIAALKVVNTRRPFEVIVAAPVASPDRLSAIQRLCDEIVCLWRPHDFDSIGSFYKDFSQVDDDEVASLLEEFAPVANGHAAD